jgi:hypothetical protein
VGFQGIATAKTSTATDVDDNNVLTGEYDLVARTDAASGTIVGRGTFNSVPTAAGTMTIKDDILASTAIDTTAAQDITVSAVESEAIALARDRLFTPDPGP